MPPGKPVVGQILVQLHADSTVSFQANVPGVNAAIMMLERTKLQLFTEQFEQEKRAAEQVIETPPQGFDHTKIPVPRLHAG